MVDMNIGDTNIILRECRLNGLTRNQTAYVLATAYWETGRSMKPVREAFGETQEQTIRRLDSAWGKGQLPWVSKPYWRPDGDGKAWFGRGYVQLTWKENYAKAGKNLGVDFVSNPEDVMKPELAAAILVRGMMGGWFTSRKLGDYVSEAKTDYINARRVVNGTDKAKAIAEIAREYDECLNGMSATPKPSLVENPRSNPSQSRTIQASAGQAMTGVGAAAGGVAMLDGTAQIIAIAVGGAVVLLALFIMRERLKAWAEGWK